MTGEAAAVKMQKERGYVVIGFPPPVDGEAQIPTIHREFAGALLASHNLMIIGPTDRADWETQVVAIFGPKHRANRSHPPLDGERFYRGTLMEVTPCAPSK